MIQLITKRITANDVSGDYFFIKMNQLNYDDGGKYDDYDDCDDDNDDLVGGGVDGQVIMAFIQPI